MAEIRPSLGDRSTLGVGSRRMTPFLKLQGFSQPSDEIETKSSVLKPRKSVIVDPLVCSKTACNSGSFLFRFVKIWIEFELFL